MAATFTVEDGNGLAAANAYVSLADADQYNDDHNADSVWDALSDANKQKNIRIATQYLDTKYRNRWKGQRSSEAQGLAWPRINVLDYDEYETASNVLPSELVDACVEGAIFAANGEDLLPEITTPGSIKKTKDKVGPVTTEIEYLGAGSQFKKFTIIDTLVRDLILSGREISRS